MACAEQSRERALSHKEYLASLQRPTTAEWRRISDYQKHAEIEIDKKYHTAEEHEAATKIQKAYRGHRERRQLQGLTLDPSSRWTDFIREWRYRSATVPHRSPSPGRPSSNGRERTTSEAAKAQWRRIGQIAEHAGGGEARSPRRESNDYLNAKGHADAIESEDAVDSMLMDLRYFLEMIDQKHRYGANLLVYHEEWQRSTATQNFFYWLDYGDGRNMDLPGCSREKLDRERIRYLSKDERMNYLTVVDDEGRLRWYKNNEPITTSSERYKDSMTGIVTKDDDEAIAFDDDEVTQQLSDGRRLARHLARVRSGERRSSSSSDSIVSSYVGSDSEDDGPTSKASKKTKKKLKSLKVSPATVLNKLLRATVKPGTWIYVADTVGRLYVGIKSSGAFQHASFLSGARISSAGSIGIEDGRLIYLSPLSGHYRPTTKSFRVFINTLKNQGVDMSHVKVSHAFEVLLSMEYYGKSKKGAKKVFKSTNEKKHGHQPHHQQSMFGPASPELDAKFHMAMDDYSATNLVDDHWRKEHRKQSSLGKLMDDLKIRRKSFIEERNK